MTLEEDVAEHYTSGALLARIDAALTAAGADPANPGLGPLKPVDEFHTGGLAATTALLDHLEVGATTEVIDLGAGLGGTARHIHDHYGARVRGIDLTPAFVEVAQALNARLGVADGITMEVGSILNLPWEDESADLATMFHVGMNIPDKAGVFREAARVLRPGGHFALFDVMQGTGDGDTLFPLPWAEHAGLSHLAAPDDYGKAASAAGLTETHRRDRRDFALDYFAQVGRHIAEHGLPPVGIHLLMRDTAPQKIQNYVANTEARRTAPTEMIFQKA